MRIGARCGRVTLSRPDPVRSLYVGTSALADHEVYCCGASTMVTATRQACVESHGLDARNFFSYSFVPGPAHVDRARE